MEYTKFNRKTIAYTITRLELKSMHIDFNNLCLQPEVMPTKERMLVESLINNSIERYGLKSDAIGVVTVENTENMDVTIIITNDVSNIIEGTDISDNELHNILDRLCKKDIDDRILLIFDSMKEVIDFVLNSASLYLSYDIRSTLIKSDTSYCLFIESKGDISKLIYSLHDFTRQIIDDPDEIDEILAKQKAVILENALEKLKKIAT